MKLRGIVIVVLVLTSCTSATTSVSDTTVSNHSGPCPETIVIQVHDSPMSEMGFLYHILSSDYIVDPVAQSVTARLSTDNSELNSSRIQIRHSGQVTNFEQVSSLLHRDNSILLGLIDTDESIALSNTFPTQALFAPLQKSPDIVYWNPDVYPLATTIADHNSWDIRVMYADGAYYMDHLLATQQLKSTQPLNTYDGTPIPFIASGGSLLQQGISTVDPYAYRYIYRDWMKDISYQYVHQTGWQPYALSVSATPDHITRHKKCFEELIPALQTGLRDFLDSPSSSIAKMVDAVRQLNTTWTYTPDQAQAAVDIMIADGLSANGLDNVLGSFDSSRVTTLITSFRQALPNVPIANVTAQQLATNEFLDSTISLR